MKQQTKVEREWYRTLWQLVGCGIEWNAARSMMVPLAVAKALSAQVEEIKWPSDKKQPRP